MNIFMYMLICHRYYIPHAFLRSKENLLVVFEEIGGDPEGINVVTVRRDTICIKVSEFHPRNIKSWSQKDNKFIIHEEDVYPKAVLRCSKGKLIEKIDFASFGNPKGDCGNLTIGTCHADAISHVKKVNRCLINIFIYSFKFKIFIFRLAWGNLHVRCR